VQESSKKNRQEDDLKLTVTQKGGKNIDESPDLFFLIDDLLKRDRFVYVGWSGLLLFPCAFLSLGGWLTGITFVSSC
jgi:hypothetical protein